MGNGDVVAAGDLPDGLAVAGVNTVSLWSLQTGQMLTSAMVQLDVSGARSSGEATRLGRLLDPLRDPCFRRLAGGRAISVLGDWLLVAGLVGWVYGRTGSTTR